MGESLGVRKSILEHGYAPVGIDLTKSDLQSAIDAFHEFVQLDDFDFEATQFFSTTTREDNDFGYYRRKPGGKTFRGQSFDNKHYFHFGSQTEQRLAEKLGNNQPHELRNFIKIARDIFWIAQKSKEQVISELDHKDAGLTEILPSDPHRGTINDALRFLLYLHNDGDLAKGHYDRSVFTMAIGESHEGLRLAKGQNGLMVDCNKAYMSLLESNLQPVEHIEREAKFFLGAGWNRLEPRYRLGNEDLPLAWHDVIESDKQVNEEIMRWAIVLFINPILEHKGYKAPTPEETRPYRKLGRLTIESATS